MILGQLLLSLATLAGSPPADEGLEYSLQYSLGGVVDCAYEPAFSPANSSESGYWALGEDDLLKSYIITSPGNCPEFVPLAGDRHTIVHAKHPTINGGKRLKFNPDMTLRALGGTSRWSYMMSSGSGIMVSLSTFPSTTEGLVLSLWNAADGVRLDFTTDARFCYMAQMGATVYWSVCSPPDSARPTENVRVFAWVDNAGSHILVSGPRGEFSGASSAAFPPASTTVTVLLPHVGRSVGEVTIDGIGMEIGAWWFLSHAGEASNRVAAWSAFKGRY